MGGPLLVIGASAGHWLPRAGHWMERIKTLFGVLLLAVALWLVERILPSAAAMVLWATLLIVTATYMGALQPVVHGAPAWRTLIKGLGLVLLIYGVLLLVGVAAGGRDPWQPLRGVGLIANAAGETPAPAFRRVKTVAEVDDAPVSYTHLLARPSAARSRAVADHQNARRGLFPAGSSHPRTASL